MNLRTRILLGYGYLVTLVMIGAAGAALGFHGLGTSIGQVLEENFVSARASMAMLEALERQDSALLAALLGEDHGSGSLTSSESAFFRALKTARDNITVEEETAVIARIESRFAAFREARDRLLATTHEHPLRAYEEETFPLFERVKEDVYSLLDVNHKAMVDADRRAQRRATARAVLHGLLVAVALLSMVFLSREMSRSVLDRLDELKAVAQAIAAGDLGRRVAVGRSDELGVVAAQINAMLDRRLELEAETSNRLSSLRQLLLGLLHGLPEPAALLALDGTVMASTLDRPATEALRTTAPRHLQPLTNSSMPEDGLLHAGTTTFRLLHTEADRPVAWLATVSPESAEK